MAQMPVATGIAVATAAASGEALPRDMSDEAAARRLSEGRLQQLEARRVSGGKKTE